MHGHAKSAGSGRSATTGRDGLGRPLTVRVEFVVVKDEAAELFASRQTRVILNLLRWVDEHGSEVEIEGDA